MEKRAGHFMGLPISFWISTIGGILVWEATIIWSYSNTCNKLESEVEARKSGDISIKDDLRELKGMMKVLLEKHMK
jgi:hypothetical protein